jgi:uncharacterized protein (TIGR02265 family)
VWATARIGARRGSAYDDLVFAEPDWSEPIDFEARIAAIPKGAYVRGMFFQFLIDAIGPEISERLGGRRYVAFKNYPVREYVETLAQASKLVERQTPPAQYLRDLGKTLYPKYANTVSGTAIFAVAGRNYRRVVELCPTAYRVTTEPSTVNIVSISDSHALCELRNVWSLPEVHHVGIWEGAMLVCGVTGRVRVQPHDFGSVDFEVTWTRQ